MKLHYDYLENIHKKKNIPGEKVFLKKCFTKMYTIVDSYNSRAQPASEIPLLSL